MVFKGYWALPGGRVDPGETVEQSVVREVKEETGLDVEIVRKIGEYHEIGVQDEMEYDYYPSCFLVKTISGRIKRQQEEIEEIEKIEEIEEIVAIVNDSWQLSSEEQQRIEKVRTEMGTPFCHWCAYCQPCPQKVDIPWVMNARNIDSYGEYFPLAVARAVETTKNCVQCGECEKKCPYHLPIREMMADNIKFFEEWKAQQAKI